MDFRRFDSSIIFIIMGGILMSIGDFPEGLSQAILVGIMLVGRLGVLRTGCCPALSLPVAPGDVRLRAVLQGVSLWRA